MRGEKAKSVSSRRDRCCPLVTKVLVMEEKLDPRSMETARTSKRWGRCRIFLFDLDKNERLGA